MNRFGVYSRMYTYTKKGVKKYFPKGIYTLMEPIQEWYNVDRGLAKYLHDELNDKVNYIHYTCINDGYVEFDVKLRCDETDTIVYEGEKCTLKTAVCKYIQGQISDGWGENGIYVLKGWIGCPVKHVELTYDLYEKDYQKSIELAKKAGEKLLFGTFEDYPAYKKIKIENKF